MYRLIRLVRHSQYLLNQDAILALALAAAESFLVAKFPALGDQIPVLTNENPCSSWQANYVENAYLTGILRPFSLEKLLHLRISPAEIPVLCNRRRTKDFRLWQQTLETAADASLAPARIGGTNPIGLPAIGSALRAGVKPQHQRSSSRCPLNERLVLADFYFIVNAVTLNLAEPLRTNTPCP